MNHNRSNQGFTLIELMIVVALIAIFATLAGPSMGDMIARQRISAAANDFANSLVFAKNESVRQSRAVFVVPGRIKSDGKFDVPAAQTWKSWEDKETRALVVFSDKHGGKSQEYDSEEDLRVTQFNPNLSFNLTAVDVSNKPVADFESKIGFVFTTNALTRIKKDFHEAGLGKLGLTGRIVIADKKRQEKTARGGAFCRVVRVESISRATACTARETMQAADAYKKNPDPNNKPFCYCDKEDLK
ncbi:MAG: GspH/FimT family pseudopilin [Neisseriaceae bacterium]|nr:GspH/FimT family pseudopilin [Neisseriaceae bacterium]